MNTRFTRRLLFAVLWLAVLDPFVPHLLLRLERVRYDTGGVFRFENSDLFALGPLVSYLRENRQDDRRRVVFFGNSIVFGYGLSAREAIPARYQRQRPDSRVFTAAFNGAGLTSSYLIAKTLVESVDSMFVLVTPRGEAHGLLPSLIPVEESDLGAFGLPPRDRVESRLQSLAGVWRLYGSRYRLQAALFSTSARQYVYLHKRDFVRRLASPFTPFPTSPPAPAPPPSEVRASNDDGVVLRAPRAASPPDAARRRELREHHPLLCSFADLALTHRKRAVFIQVDDVSVALSDSDAADFNAMFSPVAETVILAVPAGSRIDALHLTPGGAQAVAAALSRHESAQRTLQR